MATLPNSLKVRIVVWSWLVAALLVGRQQWLAALPGPAIPGLIGLLTAILLATYGKVTAVRTWVDALDLRVLVGLHVTRFVGFYFLMLYHRDELPYAFAVPGGWGDNVVAALALGLCVLPLRDALRRRLITMWNVVGFMDLLLVVGTAASLTRQDPGQMRALTGLPLSLLPTLLVPLLMATHVLLFLRLRRPPPAT